jgi:hypothetical protein
MPLSEAAALTRTCDLWLFRGRKIADRAIRAATNSPINHVGMAVVLDHLPPLLWHAELGQSVPDVWTGQRQRGVQLHRLTEAVEVWHRRYGQRAFMRQFHGEVTTQMEDELLRVIDTFDGRRFPKTLGLARQWLAGRFRHGLDNEAIYCAELLAVTYQRMGLLGDRRPANWYDAGRFWSGDRLDLRDGAWLGDEVEVVLDDDG